MHGPGLTNRFRLNTKRLVAEFLSFFLLILEIVQKKRQITLDNMDNENIVCPESFGALFLVCLCSLPTRQKRLLRYDEMVLFGSIAIEHFVNQNNHLI